MESSTAAGLPGDPLSRREHSPSRALGPRELLVSNYQGNPAQRRDQVEKDRAIRASTANLDDRPRRRQTSQSHSTVGDGAFASAMPRIRLWVESLPTTPSGQTNDPPDDLDALYSDPPCGPPSPKTYSTASMPSEGQHGSTIDARSSSTKAAGVDTEAARRALRRARNREAAHKSRAKKSKEISILEEDVQRARVRRAELSTHAEELRSEVFMLKNEILMHCDCDDAPIRQYLTGSISKLQSGLLQD